MSTGSVLPLDRDTATRHKEDVGVHITLYCTAPPQHTLSPSTLIDCLRPLTLHRLPLSTCFIVFSPSTHASSVSFRPLTLHRFLSVHSRFIVFSPSTHASSVSLRPLTLHRFLSVHSRFIVFSPSTHASSFSLRPLTLHRFLSVHSRFIVFSPSTHTSVSLSSLPPYDGTTHSQ